MADAMAPLGMEVADAPPSRVQAWALAGGLAVVACVIGAIAGADVPDGLDSGFQGAVMDAYRWIVDNANEHWLWRVVFNPLKDGLRNAVDFVEWILLSLRWVGVLLLFGAIGWRSGGIRAGLSAAAFMVGVGALGVWDQAMESLAIMTVAVVLALMVGVPLGIWTSRSDRAEAFLRPVLDTAQVLPTFVYLVPLTIFLGLQAPPALAAAAIYAIPPAVRLTSLGLRNVPVVVNEAGQSFGCTSWQQLVKVQLPMARRTILLGLNQVIMMAFGIVVIAALLGTTDTGSLVLKALQKNDVGAAFIPGLALVFTAMALDRMTTGERPRSIKAPRFTSPWSRNQTFVGALGLVLVVAVIAKLAGSDSFPSWLTVDISDAVNDVVDWIQRNLRDITDKVNDILVVEILERLKDFLTWLPWLTVVGLLAVIGWVSGGIRLAVICAVCMLGIASMGSVPGGEGGTTTMWDHAMNTLSLVIVSIVLAVIIAVPLGIWAGRSDRFNTIIRPFLDIAQVMPQFVYLIPAIALFNPGRGAGVFAAVIYAIPPCIRLTSLGLREVPITPREAAISFGATPRQEMLKVQLPLALKAVLLGINQTILMVLATVVIASLVGAGALGLISLGALNKPLLRMGEGVAAGISLVLLAIVLDRITQAWGSMSPTAGGNRRAKRTR